MDKNKSKYAKPKHYQKITDQQLIDALRACAGFHSDAAAKLGVTRKTVTTRVNQQPEIFKPIIEETRANLLDLAESKLVELIKGNNLTAIIFFLKCVGKDRGYVERVQTEDVTPLPIQKRIIITEATITTPNGAS